MSSARASESNRRSDIQGLRAVAVLLVAAYHSGIGLTGGFVGVDVFFVISGFVITASLLRELGSDGRIGMARFYARRVRRLLPAVSLMVAVVLVLVAVTTNPYDTQPFYVQTAAAAQAFVANLFLYRHVGYFDVSAAQNPFLHMWSLSVEEQFYLVFPWLLVAAAGRHRRPRRITVVLAMCLVISLATALLLTSGHLSFGLDVPERFAYFAAPTRAWEFLAGSILATQWERVRAFVAGRSTPAAWLGVAALVVGAVTSGYTGQSPSGVPIVTAMGSLLLLAAGAAPNRVSAALSWRPLVVLGDWSYAWYLWHWPMIVLVETLWPTRSWLAPIAAVVSLAPAALSTILVERPLRVRPTGRLPVRVPVVALMATALLVSGAVWFGARDGWGVEVPGDWYNIPPGRIAGCTLLNRDIANTWSEEHCLTPGRPGRLALILGDEVADNVAPGVADAVGALGYGTAVWARVGCPFSARTPVDYPQCDRWNRDAMDLVDRLRPDIVVIGNDGVGHVSPDAPTPLADGRGGHTESTAAALASWRVGLDATLNELQRRDIAVVVVSSVPDYGTAFPRRSASVLRPHITVPTMSRATVLARGRDVAAVEQGVVADHDGAAFVDPVDALCPTSCRPMHEGVWWYYEADLLTVTGSRQLAPDLEAAVRHALDGTAGR